TELCLHVVFFFQAEDGIRAFHVTGVQTYALPICWPSSAPCVTPSTASTTTPTGACGWVGPIAAAAPPIGILSSIYRTGPPPGRRSEERRVGNECKHRCVHPQERP